MLTDPSMELDFHKDPSILGDIVDAMAVGVFTVDAKGHFVAWSEGAERITGYSRLEVIGKPCHILEGQNCKGFGRLADLLQAADPPADGICNQECKVMAKDGREVHIHGSVRLLRDDNGGVSGAVGSFTDVTSLVLANEKIARLEEQTGAAEGFEQLIGKSPAMQETFRRLKLAADSDVAVLVTGESPVKNSRPRPFTRKVSDTINRSWLSTARRFRKRCWKASCSAT
jgi:PAS domain S-box-containing protein